VHIKLCYFRQIF